MVDKIEEYFSFDEEYEIKDGLIYTDGLVKLLKQVTKLPFQFGEVGGNFLCFKNQLTTLEGAPTSVGSRFNCSRSQLTTLEGAPTSVGSNFDCSYNQLSSLISAPISVGGNFYCAHNKLTSLEGAPPSVGGSFHCLNNQLTNLVGAPKSIGSYFIIDWSKDLLMLKLLMYKKIAIYENDQIHNIFQKYLNQPNKKKAILDCQKELIDNGFVGNAGW